MADSRKSWMVGALVAGVFFAFFIGVRVHLQARLSAVHAMRDKDLPVTVKQAAPIIAAIERYIEDHRKPPESLASLMPKDLPQLPDAGPVAENGWHYSTDVDEDAGGWTLLIWVRREYSDGPFTDRFVFRPSGNYPTDGYGGSLLAESSGEWAYYVE